MQSSVARAPAVVKLFGEHAVVYGKTCVAAAIDMFATAEVSRTNVPAFTVALVDLNKKVEIDVDKLSELYRAYKRKNSFVSYLEENNQIEKELLPCLTIAAKLAVDFGADLRYTDVMVKSDINTQRGLASSAACYTAFTCALLKAAGVEFSDQEAIELAKEGEKITHRNEGAGRIDVSTSYFGGVVSYDSLHGAVKEDVNADLPLLLVDTGPKKSTAEAVGRMAELYNERSTYLEDRLTKIEECSSQGLAAIREGNLEKAGELMYKNHELLRQLGASSQNLDDAVQIAKAHGLAGAKLSGGGGGGMAILLIGNSSRTSEAIDAIEAKGFWINAAAVTQEGAKTRTKSRVAVS